MTDGTFNKCDRRHQGGLDLTTATITGTTTKFWVENKLLQTL